MAFVDAFEDVMLNLPATWVRARLRLRVEPAGQPEATPRLALYGATGPDLLGFYTVTVAHRSGEGPDVGMIGSALRQLDHLGIGGGQVELVALEKETPGADGMEVREARVRNGNFSYR